MNATTVTAVREILKTDGSVGDDERRHILSIMQGARAGQAKTAVPRLLRRRQVADRLSVSLRTVDNLARDGSLRRVKFPGRQRGVGFLESDVDGLMELRSGVCV